MTGSNACARPAANATASGPGRSTTSATFASLSAKRAARPCARRYAVSIAGVTIGRRAVKSGWKPWISSAGNVAMSVGLAYGASNNVRR